jgi:hypothetical protein
VPEDLSALLRLKRALPELSLGGEHVRLQRLMLGVGVQGDEPTGPLVA